jgi:hypothetical protein
VACEQSQPEGQTVGVDCYWKVVEMNRNVNASCVNTNVVNTIIKRNESCWDGQHKKNDARIEPTNSANVVVNTARLAMLVLRALGFVGFGLAWFARAARTSIRWLWPCMVRLRALSVPRCLGSLWMVFVTRVNNTHY